MKTTLKFGFAMIIIASAILSSCGKYEEGPGLSLASKKGRVANTWAIEAYLEDGVDKTTDYRAIVASESYVFEKDGKFTTSQTTTAVFGNQTFTDNGTWELTDKKEHLQMLSSAVGSTNDTMQIVRLKSNEMWIKSVSGTPVSEMHLISK